MRKTIIRKTLCIMIACVLMFSMAFPAFASTPAEDAHLHFNKDGKFRILNFSDLQDDETLDVRVKTFIRQAVYTAQPDLIVLTGDNIYGRDLSSYGTFQNAIGQFMDIFESLGVPVAIVFGNHDFEEDSAVSKEEQMKIYNRYSVSISYDEGGSMYGCGTYNVPIYGSTARDQVKFNLWMFDTGSEYSVLGNVYDCMRENQLNWYAGKSNELKAANGGKAVQSIAFQHIIVNEIYDVIERVPSGTPGAVTTDRGKRKGNYYVLPDTAEPGSVMRETPSPSSRAYEKEFSYIRQQGDVLAIVSGHDHQNMFVVPYQGVDLINTPAAGFYEYNGKQSVYHGDDDTRGARIIDIKETEVPGEKRYTTQMLFLRDLVPTQPQYYEPTSAADKYVKDIALCYESVSDHGGNTQAAIAAAYRRLYTAVDAAHGNGVALWADLNSNDDIHTLDSKLYRSNVSHTVICMGYTLTNDPAEAMRSLRLCCGGFNVDLHMYDSQKYPLEDADGSVWTLCNYGDRSVDGTDGAVNLNYGTSGKSIYFVANYDTSFGSPLKQIRIVNTGADSAINMSEYPDDHLAYAVFGIDTGDEVVADLNKTAWGDYIYALYRTPEQDMARIELNTRPLRQARFDAVKRLQDPYTVCSEERFAALQSALEHADMILHDLNDDNETSVYNQAALDAATYRLVNCIQNLETATYTVTFDANGGTCGEQSRTISYGDFCGELPIARKDNRFLSLDSHFDGWFTERTGGEQITPETIFTATSDQTWYAHWSSAAGIVGPRPIEVVPQHPFDDSLQPAIGIAGKDNFDLDHQKYVPVRADVNADGAVDLKDITLLTRHLAGGWNVDIEVDNADVNADGKVDLRDAVLMRRYLAGGWDVKLA